ncbi:MAG: hypothetical protein NZ736_00715 [Candidatus Poseidoniaceae archaeon]|nr:hypothetical protein [Candidatus Poseidoniaceae archaeon]
MEIATATLATAVQAVKLVVSAYDGYEKGRFMKTDEAVRAEIQRRCQMLIRHSEKLERDAHEKGHRDIRLSLGRIIDSLQSYRGDAQFALSGTNLSGHSGIGKLKSKAVRKLVDHDSASLNSLVEATRMGNALAETASQSSEEELRAMVAEWHQKINRARNHFLERNMFIDGLTKR